MAFEVTLTIWGVKLKVDGFQRSTYDLDKVLTIVRGFQFFVIGLAVATFGATWVEQLVWLLVLSLALS